MELFFYNIITHKTTIHMKLLLHQNSKYQILSKNCFLYRHVSSMVTLYTIGFMISFVSCALDDIYYKIYKKEYIIHEMTLLVPFALLCVIGETNNLFT